MSKNRKSFTEQLLNMLVNEKALNNKNVLILIILIGVIAIAGVFLSFTPSKRGFNNNDEMNYIETDYNIAVLENIGYSKAEIEEMDEETILSLGNDIMLKTYNQVAGDEWKEELPYSKSMEIKTKFYQYAMSGDYDSILNEYENLKLNYYLSEPYNKPLIRIYNDAYIINSALSDKNNLVQQKDTLTKINDERMLLSIFLQSNLKVRNEILKDRMSLTLSNEDDNLRINSVTSSTMAYSAINGLYEDDVHLTKMFEYINDGDFIIYKVHFSLGLDSFNAYMYKDLGSLKLEIFGIYPDEKTALNSNYTTVAESEEILSNMYNYNNSMSDFYSDIDTTVENSEGIYN